MTAPTRNRLALKANQPFESISTRTVLNETQKGRLNNGGEVTLTANSATTTIVDDLITTNSRLLFAPKTASAKTEGIPNQDDPTSGQIVINHTNSAVADRTYVYGVFF